MNKINLKLWSPYAITMSGESHSCRFLKRGCEFVFSLCSAGVINIGILSGGKGLFFSFLQ